MINVAIIITVLVVLLVLTILLFVVMRVMPVVDFIYPVTRIQARSGLLIDEKKIKSLFDLKSNTEFANALLTTEYVDEVQKVQNKSDITEVHKALEKGYLKSVENVKKVSPENAQVVIDAYLMFQEARVLKTIYRALLTNTKVDESIVFPVGNVDYNLLSHLLKAETIADLGVVMESTIYGKVFRVKYESLESFEVAIDNFVYHYFLNVLNKIKFVDKNIVKNMFKLKIDIQNYLALIRFHVRNVPVDKRTNLLIDNVNTDLSKIMNNLVKADEINDLVKLSSSLPYSAEIEDANKLYNDNGLLTAFEVNLNRYFKNYVQDMARANSMSSVVLFSYLFNKEIEKRNLFVVSKGIEMRSSYEDMQELIL